MTKLDERILSVRAILEEQNDLNTLMAGDKWKSTRNIDDYLFQIITESIELATTSGLNYKWWSKTDISKLNMWNVKIEAIDILHFAASAIMLVLKEKEYGNYDSFADSYLGIDVAKLSANLPQDYAFPQLIKDGNQLDYTEFMNIVRAYSWINTDEFKSIDNKHIHLIAANVLNSVFVMLGMTSVEISAIYTAKATLNRIRMSSGYKDGKYVKVTKEGVEDNERMRVHVENFLLDNNMTLKGLAKAIRNEFFAPV